MPFLEYMIAGEYTENVFKMFFFYKKNGNKGQEYLGIVKQSRANNIESTVFLKKFKHQIIFTSL